MTKSKPNAKIIVVSELEVLSTIHEMMQIPQKMMMSLIPEAAEMVTVSSPSHPPEGSSCSSATA